MGSVHWLEGNYVNLNDFILYILSIIHVFLASYPEESGHCVIFTPNWATLFQQAQDEPSCQYCNIDIYVNTLLYECMFLCVK